MQANDSMFNMEFEIERMNVEEKGQKLLWCPFAEISKTEMPTKGKYKNLYPSGITVHFTAGRSMKGDRDSENCLAYGKKQGYAYWCLSRDGTIFQSHSLDSWGYHAGKAHWGQFTSCSDKMLGLEINCAGKLTKKGGKYFSWFGEEYPENEVRFVKAKENMIEGYYHKYTEAQEKSLIQLCLWLKSNNPDVFNFDNVAGHDEIAIPHGRKNDPGGSLSMTMPELRKMLRLEYAKL